MKLKVKIIMLAVCLLLGILCVKYHTEKAYCKTDLKEKKKIEVDIDIEKYYYKQLSSSEKQIYDGLASSKEDIINNMENICIASIEMSNEEIDENIFNIFSRAVWAYRLDNPLSTLWFSTYEKSIAVYTSTEDGMNTFKFYVGPKGNSYYSFDSKEDLLEAIEEIETNTQIFVESLSGTDEEKLLSIYNWILQGTKYSQTSHMSDLYGCIIQKETVCGGLSYSMKYVADMADIPVLSVVGNRIIKDASGNKVTEYHAWNMIYLSGEWYLSDPTFDMIKEPNNEPTYKCFMLPVDKDKYYPDMFQIPN